MSVQDTCEQRGELWSLAQEDRRPAKSWLKKNLPESHLRAWLAITSRRLFSPPWPSTNQLFIIAHIQTNKYLHRTEQHTVLQFQVHPSHFAEIYYTYTTDNASINGHTQVCGFYFTTIYLFLKVRGYGAYNDWHLICIIWIREQDGTPDARGSRS